MAAVRSPPERRAVKAGKRTPAAVRAMLRLHCQHLTNFDEGPPAALSPCSLAGSRRVIFFPGLDDACFGRDRRQMLIR